jgi:tetraacyldisaccharide 4'-kinase
MVNNLNLLLIPLRPIGIFYAFLMKIRAWLFQKEILPRHEITVPVISAGNLTMGGSGKTPVVIYLARYMLQKGLKPAVISRGYGGAATGKVNIISDGKRILLDSRQAGDEPRFIAEAVPDAFVLTGKKRIYPCRYAAEVFHCDIIILDDGFQHLTVKRDIDLVLFNGFNVSKNMHVFPGGFLREPFSALDRADCFLITGCPQKKPERLSTFLRFLKAGWQEVPLFLLQYQAQNYIDRSGKTYPLTSISKPVLAFCGIASPQRFQNSLEQLSVNPVHFIGFQDHKVYSEKTIGNIKDLAVKHRAEVLLTTEKDLVKLQHADFGLPLFALSMQVEANADFEKFLDAKLVSKW